MVFNGVIVLSVAHFSAEAWQRISCISDRITSHQLLDLICCFPLQQLGRLALCIWTFLCVPPPNSFYSYGYASDSDSDSDRDHRHQNLIHRRRDSSSSTVDLDAYYDESNSHSD